MNEPDNFAAIFDSKDKILVVMAHPDDAEILAGGTISKLTSQGKQVRLVVITDGGKGYQDRDDISESEFGRLRTLEQISAAEVMGIPGSENFNLGVADGEVENSLSNIEKIVFHIREFRPDIVITHNIDDNIIAFSEDTFWVNHRDHRHTAQIVLDAVYPYSRDRGFFPEQLLNGLQQHTVNEVLFADVYAGANLVRFEVGGFVAQKTKALKQHRNAIAEENVESYIEDFRNEDGSYTEVMRWVKVY